MPAPPKFQLNQPKTSDLGITFNLGDQGLFPQKEMEKLQNIIQYPYQRSAMESSWTHRILGEKYDDSWQFSNIFTTNDVSRLTTKAWDQITGWFWKMSYGYLFIFSIWVTYRIIKVVLVTIINAFNLYQLRGCTTWLCLSFCNAIPVWMLTRYINKERNNKAHQDEETGQQANTTNKQRNNNESIDLSDYIPMNM